MRIASILMVGIAFVSGSVAARPCPPAAVPCPKGTSLAADGRETTCLGRDGQRHGPYVAWHRHGAMEAAGQYEAGARSGMWTFFAVDGRISAVASFVGNDRAKLTVFDSGEVVKDRNHARELLKSRHGIALAEDLGELFEAGSHYPSDHAVGGGVLGALSSSDHAVGGRVLGGWAGPPAAVRVRSGSASVNGELEMRIIRHYVRMEVARLKACYGEALARDPQFQGTLTVSFEIDPQGMTRDVKVEGQADVRLVSCVEGTISAIRFPKPKSGSVDVTYPLHFEHSPLP